MMSQNRQVVKDRLGAGNDYEVNIEPRWRSWR